MLKTITSKVFQFTPCRGKWASLNSVIGARFQSTIDYSSTKCDGLVFEPKDQVLWLKFDRPSKFNAITREMYGAMIDTFTKVNKDNSIKALVLTGNGNYYSSGNDLAMFISTLQGASSPRETFTEARDILYRFVDSLINLDKLMIAAVNGPAVGIPVTTLPLCDYVLASDRSTFQSPFTALGQCPEACSSITFPQTMGSSRASELLLLNMTWSAKKAQTHGLVSDVVEHDKFQEHLENFLYGKQGVVNSCYPNSMMVSKSLIRSPDVKQKLMEANRRECDAILECWLGAECSDAIQKFMKRSKK